MSNNIFNRTIFLWAGALAIAFFITNPRAALVQRINTMNVVPMACLSDGNCADTKEITKARLYYMILAQLYPDYGRGAEMEGLCYVLLKQDNLAIKKFQEAIEHNPDLFWVDFELGKAFYRSRDYPKAFGYFQRVIGQDNNALFRKAALSSLQQVPDKTKTALMYSLIGFVADIKLRSYQMACGCLLHQGDLVRAYKIISLGMNDQGLADNEFFRSAEGSLGEDNTRKEMLTWIDFLAESKPVFHPWGYVIEPLKEAFLN
jgi:tetratricopeptide (TPR) repeat protein